jgi:hypothetical protein
MSPRALIFVAALTTLSVPRAGTPLPPSRSPHASFAMDVLVLATDGTPITDLAQSEFELIADGAPIGIERFDRSASTISVVLLVDGTASQPLKRYEILAGVTTGFVPALRPADRARVAWLGNPTTLTPWLASDRVAATNQVRPVLDRLPLEPSPIWDAIDLSVQALASAPEPRVLLLMTDGRATGNRIGLDEAERKALAANVSISAVSEGGEWLIPQFGGSTDRARSDASLRRLADETGGMYLPDGTARRTLRAQMNAFAYVKELVNTPSLPAPLITQILSSLRSRYRLGFSAISDGNLHRVEVRVKRPGVEVRAPRLYVG